MEKGKRDREETANRRSCCRARCIVQSLQSARRLLTRRRTGYGEGYNTVLPRAQQERLREPIDRLALIGFAELQEEEEGRRRKEQERERERVSE